MMVPIWALAYGHHEDPEMRPYDKPISDEQREELIIGAAAGVHANAPVLSKAAQSLHTAFQNIHARRRESRPKCTLSLRVR